MTTSRLPGFHNLTRQERLKRVAEAAHLSRQQHEYLTKAAGVEGDLAENLSENVIGVMSVPLGIATNLIVDGDEVLVAMATEESSVVAAVCNGALACRATGGVTTNADAPQMIAQIQVLDVEYFGAARKALEENKGVISRLCNDFDPQLATLGGGFRDLEIREIDRLLVLHLVVDVRDAMGANAVNSMAEMLAPYVEKWTGGRVGLRILSNLADRRLVRAKAVWPRALLGAERVERMCEAYAFAAADPYRAATHNKGIMNGIDAVAMATGNDTRALEAGAHAFAATRGTPYKPLTTWNISQDGDLIGALELPMPVGIIGGATKAHPTAQIALKIMDVTSADRLARVMAAVGLVQNFSALRALAGEGIQRGHMGLHARNVAISAGATGEQIERVAQKMIQRGVVREDAARALIKGKC